MFVSKEFVNKWLESIGHKPIESDDIANILKDLWTLSDDELSSFWICLKDEYKITTEVFTNYYKINRSNFGSYVCGRRRSTERGILNSYKFAILTELISPWCIDIDAIQARLYIMSLSSEKSDRQIQTVVKGYELCGEDIYSNVMHATHLVDVYRYIAQNEKITNVIFLDYENWSMHSFSNFVSKNDVNAPIVLIQFVSERTIHGIRAKLIKDYCLWTYTVVTSTRCRGAADVVMVAEYRAIIDAMVRFDRRSPLNIILCSRDGIFTECYIRAREYIRYRNYDLIKPYIINGSIHSVTFFCMILNPEGGWIHADYVLDIIRRLGGGDIWEKLGQLELALARSDCKDDIIKREMENYNNNNILVRK
jgi:hypothetical protein